MKNFLIGMFFLGFTSLIHSQIAFNHDPDVLFLQNATRINDATMEVATMPEKTVVKAINATYLNTVSVSESAKRVKSLEDIVSRYDIRQQPVFQDKLELYEINFRQGKYGDKITAVFNKDGKLIKSYERFKNIAPANNILKAISAKYPGATIKTNTYKVLYEVNGKILKTYKVKIAHNGIEKVLKMNVNGQFI